jgi:hypothetical protein
MIGRPRRYRAYLLRFWQEPRPAAETEEWRFSLEDPHTGDRRGFAGLDLLFAWLRDETETGETRKEKEKGEGS